MGKERGGEERGRGGGKGEGVEEGRGTWGKRGEESRGEEGREGEGHMKEQIVPIVVPTHQRCPVVGLEGGEVVGCIEATGPRIFVEWVAMEIEDQQG